MSHVLSTAKFLVIEAYIIILISTVILNILGYVPQLFRKWPDDE